MSRRLLILAALALASALAVAACSSPAWMTAEAPVEAPMPPPERVAGSDVGDAVIKANFAVADSLAWQMGGVEAPQLRILAATFVNRDDLDDASSLGRLAGEQVASRLAQNGFDVVESRLRSNMAMRPGKGEFVLTRRMAQLMRSQFEAEAVLLGSYTVDTRAVFLTARVVRLDDGVVLASQDYSMPNSGPVARLLEGDGQGAAMFDRYVRVTRNAGPPPAAPMGTLPMAPVAPMGEDLDDGGLLPLPGLGRGEYLIIPPGRLDQ